MKIENANELLEQYPKIQPEKGLRFHNMNGDLFAISKTGRIERVIEATIYPSKKGTTLKIVKSVLIDTGLGEKNG